MITLEIILSNGEIILSTSKVEISKDFSINFITNPIKNNCTICFSKGDKL